MFATTVTLFCVIVITALCGLYDGSVPYFPIEISRTATGSIGRIVFPTGVVLVFSFALKEFSTFSQLTPFIGLVVLSVASDTYSWTIHMFGVLLMVIGVIIRVISRNSYEHYAIVVCAIGLYLLRIVMKVIVTSQDLLGDFSSIGSMKTLLLKCTAIMYGGNATYVQLTVYRVAGVMQWLVFVMFVVACI